jgi:hypothetical protein
MLEPPRWDEQRFESDRQQAISNFRHQRLEEPLEAYLELFDRYQGVFEELLETTVDLAQMKQNALSVLGDEKLLEAFRYLAGPPISRDDLMTVAEVSSLNKKKLLADPELVKRIIATAFTALDRRRFAWIADNRDPTECERTAAVIASAALIATQRLGTERRHEGKRSQEARVEDALLTAGFRKVPTRTIAALPSAPNVGEFCGESMLGTGKADFTIRLWDQRVMALECKVSNSALNSVKRLNHDAAAKAEAWRRDFGETQIVPAAVVSGVFKLNKLQEAQRRGLSIFWAHDLDAMLNWIGQTRAK